VRSLPLGLQTRPTRRVRPEQPRASTPLSDNPNLSIYPNLNALEGTYDHGCSLARFDEYRHLNAQAGGRPVPAGAPALRGAPGGRLGVGGRDERPGPASYNIITRTSHHESFTVSGTGYMLNVAGPAGADRDRRPGQPRAAGSFRRALVYSVRRDCNGAI
jgi:hypothetical protein